MDQKYPKNTNLDAKEIDGEGKIFYPCSMHISFCKEFCHRYGP